MSEKKEWVGVIFESRNDKNEIIWHLERNGKDAIYFSIPLKKIVQIRNDKITGDWLEKYEKKGFE